MVTVDILNSDSPVGFPGEPYRFFLSDEGYSNARAREKWGEIRIKNLPDLAHARIYDRILERCAPVLFSGKNFREE